MLRFGGESARRRRTGSRYEMESLNKSRRQIGPCALGMGKLAFEMAVEHTKNRTTSSQTLAENQFVQHMPANASMDMHASWLMLIDAATRLDKGEDASAVWPKVYIFRSEAAGRVVDTGVQLLGTARYSRCVKIERLYRDGRLMRIYGGRRRLSVSPWLENYCPINVRNTCI
ncbi:acyl-CoA dehydrogenase family protein [Paraburkholderia sediminicola]|uniref:acyl-CoA dehydrogenase family protein n=1 Tax=Paraburkholderia sediminicola TaxID=458836 RepID=UPI0038B7F4EE